MKLHPPMDRKDSKRFENHPVCRAQIISLASENFGFKITDSTLRGEYVEHRSSTSINTCWILLVPSDSDRRFSWPAKNQSDNLRIPPLLIRVVAQFLDKAQHSRQRGCVKTIYICFATVNSLLEPGNLWIYIHSKQVPIILLQSVEKKYCWIEHVVPNQALVKRYNTVSCFEWFAA